MSLLTPPSNADRWQKALMMGAQLFLAFGVVLASILGILWGLRVLLSWLGVAIWPVVIAIVLSFLLKPVVEGVQKVFCVRREWVVGFLYILILAGVFSGLWSLLPLVIHQLIALIDFFPQLLEDIAGFISNHVPQLRSSVDQVITSFDWKAALRSPNTVVVPTHIFNVLQEAGLGAFSFLEVFIAGVVTFIYLFYFLLSADNPVARLNEHLSFLKPGIRQDIVFLVEEFLAILVAFFRGQLLIGLIMGCFLAAVLSLVGLKFGAVLGFTIGICNVLPYVGTILGLTVALPIAFFQPDGGPLRLGLVIGVFCLAHLIEAYILAPRIMGKRTGLHPAAIIFSLFFWGTVFDSPLGIVLAVPLSAFWVVLWRLARKKYLPSFEEQPIQAS